MKLDSKKFWRLTNVGYPNDSELGEGDAKDFAKALMLFWAKITMGSRVNVELFRSASDRDSASGKDSSIDSLADSIFAGIDLDSINMVD